MDDALTVSAGDCPAWIVQLIHIGSEHLDRFRHQGEWDDIAKAIGYKSMALALIPNNHSIVPALFNNLGMCYGARFKRWGELGDLEKAIEYETRVITLTPDSRPQFPFMLMNLGASHSSRFERLGELSDVEKAVEYRSIAITLAPDRELPSWLVNLGQSYVDRFKCLGDMVDLENAIQCNSRALALTPYGHPDLSSRLSGLGRIYRNRFDSLTVGELDDLEKAILYESRAIAMTADDHPDLPYLLSNLGGSYITRFERLGNLSDLEKSIECESRAVSLIPQDHPHLPYLLSNLGTRYSNRYKRLGELSDIEKSIEYQSRALALTPNGHSGIPLILMNIGGCYIDRFGLLGELNDLERAIECESHALALTPDDHPEFPTMLVHLGVSYSQRFMHLGELDELQKTIEYISRAISMVSDGHPRLRSWLVNLGIAYSSQFQSLGKEGDIQKSIECISGALAITPDGHPGLPSILLSLAKSYERRFTRLGELGDLENANTYALCALRLTPNGHPDLPRLYHYLAAFHSSLSRHTGDPSLFTDGLDFIRIAARSVAMAPKDKFMAALAWANVASQLSSPGYVEAFQTAIDLLPQFIWLGATTHQRYRDLDDAKSLAVSAASTAIRHSEYSLALDWLERARCVVWNQTIMLRSPLKQLHLSHPALAARIQTVGHQLHQAGSEPRPSGEHFSDLITSEETAQRHRRLAEEYNDLLSKVRGLAGFEDFLQPMRADRLVGGVRYGPIVVINYCEERCDALVIIPEQGEVKHIPLPTFTMQKAQRARSGLEKSVRSRGPKERGGERRPVLEPEDTFEDMLAILWYDIVKPVLDFLGYTDNQHFRGDGFSQSIRRSEEDKAERRNFPNLLKSFIPRGRRKIDRLSKPSIDDSEGDECNRPLPHITWCPTGPVSFLPLHAAGDYDQPRSRVFDYVISSYTPTLTALLSSAGTCSAFGDDTRVLAIGQEATPGHNPLPGTIRELENIQTHMQNEHPSQYTQLLDREATVTAVLDAMEQHGWVHLACHAHQNVADPTQSGFFLHDGVLDLAAINRRSFKQKGLAFLSACQTAKGDKELPDEAIHLASGMLMAGYSSVIATMWSVHDADAPLVADRVYARLMVEKTLGNGEAGRALHNAVAELRKEVGERSFERWVPYIHIGS